MGIISIDYAIRSSYGEALKEAGVGYLDEKLLAGEITQPHQIARPELTAMPEFFGPAMAAMAMAHKFVGDRPMRVIDYGGALGGHFAYVDKAFAGTIPLLWTVVETPIYVNYGRAYITDAQVRFATSLDEIEEPVDLAYFSSSLPYLRDWKEPFAHPAVRSAGHVLITRTTLHEREIPFLQTVVYADKTVRYAGRTIDRTELVALLNPTHTLFASWQLHQTAAGNKAYEAPAMLWRRKA